MTWEDIVKQKKRYNFDREDHFVVFSRLSSKIQKAIKEEHKYMLNVLDDIKQDMGAKDLNEYVMFLDRFMKPESGELFSQIKSMINNADNKANNILRKNFEGYSPSTEGEIEEESRIDRRAGSRREV